jgi:hypothetical protein
LTEGNWFMYLLRVYRTIYFQITEAETGSFVFSLKP